MGTLRADNGTAMHGVVKSFEGAGDTYPENTTKFTMTNGDIFYCKVEAVSLNAIDQLIAGLQGSEEQKKERSAQLTALKEKAIKNAPSVLAAQSQVLSGAAGAVNGLGLVDAAVPANPADDGDGDGDGDGGQA